LISRVIAGQRERVFLVSKVHPNHVTGGGIARACGQVYELLDILTGLASFEGRVLRPTIVSYS
jgi:diketogulonate reductase-like aldo/keto reductase